MKMLNRNTSLHWNTYFYCSFCLNSCVVCKKTKQTQHGTDSTWCLWVAVILFLIRITLEIWIKRMFHDWQGNGFVYIKSKIFNNKAILFHTENVSDWETFHFFYINFPEKKIFQKYISGGSPAFSIVRSSACSRLLTNQMPLCSA